MTTTKRSDRDTKSGSNQGSEKRSGAAGTIAAIAAIAALATGTFLMAGKRGKKNRAMVRGWMIKAKGEVLERLEQLKEVNFETYTEIVDSVLLRYRNMKDITGEELAEMADELRGHWKEILKQTTKKQPKGLTKKAKR